MTAVTIIGMELNALKRYVEDAGLIKSPGVRPMGSGESNHNYLATSGNDKIVIRIAREDTPDKPRFENEHHFLKFIESIGLSFAPRSLIYDPDLNLHIVSFVDGVDASVADLNSRQIKIFVSQLKELQAIKYRDYLDWCKLSDLAVVPSESTELRNETYVFKRIKYIKNNSVDSFSTNALKWIEDKLSILSRRSVGLPTGDTFVHGDLRWNKDGGNLRITDNKVTFIDWELSRFVNGNIPEVSDVLGSIPINITNKKLMRDLYNDYSLGEKDLGHFKDATEYGVLWSKVGNTIWATERYCFLKQSKTPDPLRYRNLAMQFMDEGNFYFTEPFNMWF